LLLLGFNSSLPQLVWDLKALLLLLLLFDCVELFSSHKQLLVEISKIYECSLVRK